MGQLIEMLQRIEAGFNNTQITTVSTITMLSMVAIFSLYEFLVYRFISKRSFYSKQFNMALAVIPFFIATIIMSLQSNLVITLGTIGALAIIRFRTAIKDPLDMVYLFWSVHTGIVCGTGLYEVALLTSIFVTIFLIILDFVPLGRAPFLLVLNMADMDQETEILTTVKKYARNSKVRSRNFSKNGLDMIIELRTKSESQLIKDITEIPSVRNAALVAHDGEKEF
ncbi:MULTISPECIES: DUF4956 domain-containing protein [unclassified Jeotgalibaca]|uniref:DUF4956 domain-containing protein n=1 Tax=unclassified Jeotgalibaca TaxID=2621505 RepID=UPI003FCF4200